MNIRMRFCTACFVVALIANGCQSKESASLTSTQKGTGTSANSSQVPTVRPSASDTPRKDERAAVTSTSKEDARNRMKECTARVDLIASRDGMDSNKIIIGRQSHYSPAFGRCYLRINYINEEANNNPDVPLNYYELWDAYEDSLLSICTDGPTTGHGVFCNIEGRGFVKCSVCQTFVKERMTR